ncbi:toxin secretion/phage lysis holin [Paenibacillus barcinonensis]|uniref:Toxin secretion/phage lysis holin n=2 Tax=Paenibacillus barcinonensis TaxID=198119 RepID=A0A2V4VZZ3_PAEBA|nr:phage holin family protein [Paenibacillus barcinonensis]PYE51425.1 toxin secretion/phage lysis holin [Paenibacillus barcinonensis]
MQKDTIFMIMFGWALSAVVYLVGGINHLLIAVTIFVGLDYFTGVLAAWYKKELSSRVGWWGLARKSLTFVFVIIAHQLDIVAGNSNDFMRDAMLMFIIGTEGISILENMGKMGLPVPKFIASALFKLRGNNQQSGDRGDSQ